MHIFPPWPQQEAVVLRVLSLTGIIVHLLEYQIPLAVFYSVPFALPEIGSLAIYSSVPFLDIKPFSLSPFICCPSIYLSIHESISPLPEY